MFEIKATSGRARTGTLKTAHGKIKTPFYMPVATKGSVKSLSSYDLEELGYECMISNSFILGLNPGADIIHNQGGLHKFMGWNKSLFTDSGGFQVLSKEFLLKKADEGVLFKDPKTGKRYNFTPEISMQNQIKIGADVAMTLDDVSHFDMSGKDYVDAIKRTHQWARRCLTEHQIQKKEYDSKQLLFGICQGGVNKEYRTFSTVKINEMGFDGVALGGLVVGESRDELMNSIKYAVTHFDNHKVKYLMGLGSPSDIVQAVSFGVDCFDSIYPTENARHGSMLTDYGRIKIMRKEYLTDYRPIDDSCKCPTCKRFTRSYVHHQLKTHELIGYKLATVHNLWYMQNLLKRIRQAIKTDTYEEFAKDYLEKYFSGNEKKEFGNNIRNKYYDEIKKKQKALFLPFH